VLIGAAGLVALRRLGSAEAVREATNLAVVTGQGIVRPRLTDGIVKGNVNSLLSIDSIVQSAVILEDPPGPIAHVRIWTPDGRIVYADAPELIDTRYPLSEAASLALDRGEPVARQVDPTLPENRFETREGPLLEVVMPVETPDGHKLLFEASLRANLVQASGRQLWSTFLPVLAVALLAFAAVQIPLAYRLARQVRESQLERERLLQQAIDASDRERRRITSDLHDGLIQELAGLSMSLSAEADTLAERDPEAAATMRDAAETTRQGMRSLRSSIMGIYPPNVQRAGLPAALSDLTAPIEARGIGVDLEVSVGPDLPADVESLLFRCAQESVRNILAHADAHNVTVKVASDAAAARLEIDDDGAGFSANDHEEARADGHLGLHILEDLVRDARGTFAVDSEPGEGTRVRLEVPLR
jgi:two-component system NarL family sensor kinase